MNIVLLHKNLRISDNSALYHGCNADKSLIIYAYDKDYWSNNGKSERQFQFCLDSLGEKARETIWSVRKGSDFKKIAKDVYLKHGSRLRRA